MLYFINKALSPRYGRDTATLHELHIAVPSEGCSSCLSRTANSSLILRLDLNIAICVCIAREP